MSRALRRCFGFLGAAALIGAALGESDANAYAVKRTSRGDLVHWDEATVHYAVDPAVEGNVATAFDATKHAMAAWSGSVGAPELRAEIATESSPKAPGFDEKNGIFYMQGGYAPAGRALAITVLTYDNVSGRILDADIIFNGKYNFQVLSESGEALDEKRILHPSNTDGIAHEDTGPRDAVYDLHHVVAHEIGHSVGMNDEMERREALMYRYSAPNDASMRAPGSDDIAGLAELYSTRLEGQGNGCGNATVAPKKPSSGASHVAMAGAIALLLFLVLRGRSDRRARAAFIGTAVVAMIAFLPSLDRTGTPAAKASELAPGHARAKVLSSQTSIESGLFKTTFKLATTACRAATCPKLGHGAVWGGTIGNLRQEVGGYYAPEGGDDVDVSFDALPSAIAPLSSPLGARDVTRDVAVRVLTRAN